MKVSTSNAKSDEMGGSFAALARAKVTTNTCLTRSISSTGSGNLDLDAHQVGKAALPTRPRPTPASPQVGELSVSRVTWKGTHLEISMPGKADPCSRLAMTNSSSQTKPCS